MIKFNEEFECEGDNHGWALHQWRDGTDRHGKPKRQSSTTYHPTLIQVCDAIVDKTAVRCNSVEELKAALVAASEAMVKKL